MIFNSIVFLLFFVILFFLYWIVAKNNLKLQNIILLFGGYLFYGWSDWRLLSYLLAASIINFHIGLNIEKSTNERYRQFLLYLGLLQGIGGLAFFKYYNFFVTSIKSSFNEFGIQLNLHTLNILVPIGISFFTFKTISYLLDINKGKISACKDSVAFFAYVSFFPTILSGPIDRAKTFIPQLEKKREFNYESAMISIRQIYWGLFKKVVVADSFSIVANEIFNGYKHFNTITLLFGAVVYSFEMYADFSGYSDMAIGIARLLGFEVTPNFNFPFFAENIAEFWRRWHMSLTSWLTEYVFTPLSIAFRDFGKLGVIISIIINFIICGIWHGPNWTYVLWGLLHGLYFIPIILKGNFYKKKKVIKVGILPFFRRSINRIGTFLLISLTLVLFKVETIADGIGYYKQLLTFSSIHPFGIQITTNKKNTFIGILMLLLIDFWFSRPAKPFRLNRVLRYAFYIIVSLLIFINLEKKESFIYFKF